MYKKLLLSLAMGVFFCASLFSGVSLAGGAMGNMETKIVGNTKVELMTEPSPAKVGENKITVHILDQATGKGISGASINVEAAMEHFMGNMNMSPIKADLSAGKEAGDYSGNVNFSDKGAWKIKVTFNSSGKQDSVEFDLNVAESGPNWNVIGGFTGIILLIILTAAIMKKRATGARG